jgi:microcystin-dependent protein
MEGTMASIMFFAGDFAPRYWAYCNGQILSIATNQAMFALLGTTYGGNGTTTFALPNFQGRAALGTSSNHPLGEPAGTPTVTLTLANLAGHTHVVTANLAATKSGPNTDEGPGNILAATNMYASSGSGSLAGVGIQPSGFTGQNAPVTIMQPYLGMNFIICVQGVFPSRS